MYKRKKQTKTTNMLNKKIIDLINEQIWLENNASFYYLHLSIQFSINGFGGISNFFKEQSEEEREHMIKLIEYKFKSEFGLMPYPYIRGLDLTHRLEDL